ncbi:hypothetical protein I3843_06G113500 [Carya illinoinensis]|nr:hypothetical protein I3760_06G121300 [Carya illinoinensis]KAG7975715.1 hypothetical protein I3843_06G113500 [Carya illinoinensis]
MIRLGGSCLKLPLPIQGNRHQLPTPPIILTPLSTKCTLTKQAHRFLSTLTSTALRDSSASAIDKLIRKFVESSPKSVALGVLSHLLSPRISQPHLSSLALPLYRRITEAPWFNWNPKLVANLVALLDEQGRFDEWEMLISDAVSKLELRERELALFYCNLIESHSKQGSQRGFDASYARLNQLLHNSDSIYVKRRGYESMVSGLCTMDRPREAENMFEEMRVGGLKPSRFEFRCVLYGYGRLGLFEDMQRIVVQMKNEGVGLDTVCSNMILSAYGSHKELAEMAVWLRKMKASSIPFTVRTYNSVLNSCPKVMAMLQDMDGLPLSIEELSSVLNGDEALVVKEMVASHSVLEEVMEWDSLEVKLDLHGMHLGSAYLITLQWVEEFRHRLKDGKHTIPGQVIVVCGSGRHSSVRGESPVKGLIRKMMARMKSPMRIDRKNVGCFVGKGKAVRDWLC